MTLVDHSLLYPSDPGAPHRFYMYETVRETLKKEWSTPPKDLAARFVAAYGALHQGGRAALATPEQEQMRAQQLTAEAANLFVAQALAQSLPGDDARWVLDAFVWIWMRQGRFLECTQILTQWIHLETATEATRRDARRDYVDVCLLIRALPEVTPLIPILLNSATESLTDDVRFETLYPCLSITSHRPIRRTHRMSRTPAGVTASLRAAPRACTTPSRCHVSLGRTAGRGSRSAAFSPCDPWTYVVEKPSPWCPSHWPDVPPPHG